MPHAAQEDVKLKRKSNTGNSLYRFILAGINLDIEFKRQKLDQIDARNTTLTTQNNFIAFLK